MPLSLLQKASLRRSPLRAAGAALTLLCLLSGGCGWIATHTAPSKKASAERTAGALRADALFWQLFHSGDYAGISKGLEALTAAYLENPSDAKTASHIGWLHIWRLAEKARLAAPPPTITDDAVLARKYFQEAVSLDPSDPRTLGFLASALLAEGEIHREPGLQREGYFMLKRAIAAWPEFNLFTAGYVLSRQPADSQLFREGLAWQWENVDACVGEKVDRANPDLRKYLHLETRTGPKRPCWNSDIAPHNFEGFFMNMGDMLVKSGDWKTGQKIYAAARGSSDYGAWKFRDVLEARIRNAEANVAAFTSTASGKPALPIMNASTFSCMACHQN
jgi:hypothetical protein